MKRIDPIFQEYARLLSGECDNSDKQKILAQVESNAGDQSAYQKLKSIWNNYHPELNSADRIWELTSKKLDINQSNDKKISRIAGLWKYAAAVVFLSIGLNAYYFIDTFRQKSSEMIEYTAKTGEVKQIDLPDGSKVWLNSESTLVMPGQFKGKTRGVFLVGEAFFEVARNPQRPFLVNTQLLTVKVLGTSFSVSNYENDPEISTCLLEGSVELLNKEAPGKSIILAPNETGTLNKASGELTVSRKPDRLIAPWRKGRFRFHNNDLLSITNQLERKFDCEFVFIDEAAKTLRFTGDFETESLDEILALLNKAHTFHVNRSGNRYVISGQK